MRAKLLSAILYIIAFFWLLAAIAFYNERDLESDLLGNWFFAVGFALIPAVCGFILLVLVALLARLVLVKLLHRPLQHPASRPLIAPLAVGVVIACVPLLQDRSITRLFHSYLGVGVPSSVHDFHYWWGTLPGDSEFVFKFKINPAEFDRLLACRQFARVTDRSQVDDAAGEVAAIFRNRQDLAIPGHVPLIYEFNSQSPPGLPHIVKIFPSDNRDEVLIYGDN
jgi:hypothetical protein